MTDTSKEVRVRCTFTIEGDNDATTPAPLLADVSSLTAGRLRRYALATVADRHPAACIHLKVEGAALPQDPQTLVAVPAACLIRPTRPPRPAKAAADVDDGAAAADGDAAPEKDDAPAAAAADEVEAKADDVDLYEDEQKKDGDEADASEKKDEAAADDADEAKAGDAAADDKAADGDAAAADATKKEDGDNDAKTSPKKEKKPKKARGDFKAREPPAPPRDMQVTIIIKAAPNRLPASRTSLQKPAGQPKAAGDAILLDCGHAVPSDSIPQPATEHAMATIACPICGFQTLARAAFPEDHRAEPAERVSGYQQAPDSFQRSAAAAVGRASRVTNCVVCNENEAVGRCAVELLNMCAKCHEEHLPSGPLRATHTLLRFDSNGEANASEALAVLCTNANHRSLPVNYFCVPHGKLGCHMCLKDTAAHASCDVVSDPEDFAAIAEELRTTREAEAARVMNDAIGSTRAAWTAYAKLRESFVAQQALINAKAAEYAAEVEKQRVEALAHLEACYKDSLGRWEKRITALDNVRESAANVSAVLDGYRKLPAGLLLHAEADGALSFERGSGGKKDSAVAALGQAQKIANLSVRCGKGVPSLFDVNGSHPTVQAAEEAPAATGKAGAKAPALDVKADGVRVAQTSTDAVAKKWREGQATKASAAPAAAAAAAAADAPKGSKGKKGRELGALRDASELHVKGATQLPKVVAPTASDDDTSPSKANAHEELDSFASVVRGPKDTMLLVDSRRNAVYVAMLGKKKDVSAKVVHVLGGPGPSMMFVRSSETTTIAANTTVQLKQPHHAFHFASDNVVVVCDTGNDRVALYSNSFDTTVEPVLSPAGLVKAPLCAAADSASGGILVFERSRMVLLSADAQKKLNTFKYPGLATKGVRSFATAVTQVAANPIAGMLRATGVVSVVTVTDGTYLGDIASGSLVAPVQAKSARSSTEQSDAMAARPVAALCAHPDANVLVLATPNRNDWTVELTVVTAVLPEAQPAAAQPEPPQPGGRKRNAAPAAPPKPQPPTLKILGTATHSLSSVKTHDDSTLQLHGIAYEGPQRVVFSLSEVTADLEANEGADSTLRTCVTAPTFAVTAV